MGFFSSYRDLYPVSRNVLVEDGAVVAGPKPTDDPSLADDQAEFRKLNDKLFGDGTGVHSVGKGTVYAGRSLTDVFNGLKVVPDFDYTEPESDTRILFVHRRLADGDLYFVDNRNECDETVDASFRVTGKAPELWHAETGKSEPVSYRIADGRTTVPLHLEPWGTVLAVFRKATEETSRTLPKATERQLTTVEGPWNVTFQPERGAPPSITLDQLSSWSDNPDAGVKYFSGIGTYTKTIQAPADWSKKGAHLWIDLGDVKNLAEVTVNGKSLGIVWHAPYRGGRDERIEARRKRSGHQGDQCVGKPADRRSTARRHDEGYLCGRETVQGELAIASFRTSWTRASLFHRHKVRRSGASKSTTLSLPSGRQIRIEGFFIWIGIPKFQLCRHCSISPGCRLPKRVRTYRRALGKYSRRSRMYSLISMQVTARQVVLSRLEIRPEKSPLGKRPPPNIDLL